MSCERARRVLHEYVDDELDAASAAAVAAHLAGCPDCDEAMDELRVVRQLVSSCAVRYSGPPGLRGALDHPPLATRWRVGFHSAMTSALLALRRAPALAALALGMTLAVAIALQWTRPAHDGGMPAEVVAAHVRAMMSNRMVDVAQADHDSVKPWFRERLHFVPQFAQTATEELRLIGSRTDYVGKHVVGALVYGAGRHVVTVFFWPAHGGSHAPRAAGRLRGFNLVNWTEGGLFYCAVSDVDTASLSQLASRLVDVNVRE